MKKKVFVLILALFTLGFVPFSFADDDNKIGEQAEILIDAKTKTIYISGYVNTGNLNT